MFIHLFLDGHISHISIKVIQKILEEKIVNVELPPHTTHILQLIDVSFFRPLKAALEVNISKFQRTGHEKPMEKRLFLEEIGTP